MAEDPEVELLFSLTGTLALFAQRRFMDQVGRRYIIHHPAPPEKLIGFICARVITQTQRENPFIDQNKLELSPLGSASLKSAFPVLLLFNYISCRGHTVTTQRMFVVHVEKRP